MNQTATYPRAMQVPADHGLQVVQASGQQADMPDAVQLWAEENGFTLAALDRCLQSPPLRACAQAGVVAPPAMALDLSMGDAQKRVARALHALLPDASDQITRLHGPNGYRLFIEPGVPALTLHDARPVITLPSLDTVGDLILLAHEVGHALQLALTPAAPPPVLRELAAFVAEHALTRDIAGSEPDLATALSDIMASDDTHYCAEGRTALSRALYCGAARYDYGWNYPLPRLVAGRDATRAQAEAVFRADRNAVAQLFDSAGLSLW
ncbi:hypothetical protein [Tateyamaria omphalii]|uniref:Uncharacterized protein n=1 Tax=Tateyamaria omphalii TaxID=299262 RepID=A0A1P8MTI9_9RHOB|nr:hypothetical protein [Tateyamaria omphalii]APX11358.1 hypothetical protein BWR18_06445 [Tateyamaria omphalii]